MISIAPFSALVSRRDEGGKQRKYPVQVVGVIRENDRQAQLVVVVKNGSHCYAEFVDDVELIPQ